jgi:hypothetical protein
LQFKINPLCKQASKRQEEFCQKAKGSGATEAKGKTPCGRSPQKTAAGGQKIFLINRKTGEIYTLTLKQKREIYTLTLKQKREIYTLTLKQKREIYTLTLKQNSYFCKKFNEYV